MNKNKKLNFFKKPRLEEINIKTIRIAILTVFILTILTQLVDNAFILITPILNDSFNISKVTASWVASLAGIGLAIGFLAFSSFTDFFSERNLLWIGLFLFITPSIIGLVLQKYFYAIFIARFIQAIGGITTSAIFLVLVARYLPEKEKIIWMGLIVTSFMLATIIGTVAGGFLTRYFGWQVIFYIPFFALLSIPILYLTMPSQKNSNNKLEPIVLLILAAFGIALNFLASMPDNYILWIVNVVVITVLIIYVFKSKRLAKVENPILSKEMLKNKRYMLSLLGTFLYYLAQVAIVFLLPSMLESIYQMNTDEAALNYIAPYAIGAIVGTFSGYIIKKISAKLTLLIGGFLIIFGFIMMGFLAHYHIAWVQVCFALIVAGYSLSFTPLLDSSIKHLSPKQVGTGIGIFNFTVRTGMALGISIVAFMLNSSLANANFINFSPQQMDIYSIIFWSLSALTLIGMSIIFLAQIKKPIKNMKMKNHS